MSNENISKPLDKPAKLRKSTPSVVYNSSTDGLNTLSVGGKVYSILDVGYVCGKISCSVLSEYTCLFHPPPYCAVCPTCWHVEGLAYVPDWKVCGISLGTYGLLVSFKPPWICHCLKLLGYTSIDVNKINMNVDEDGNRKVGTSPYCGAPVINPPLFGAVAIPALKMLTLPSRSNQSGLNIGFGGSGSGLSGGVNRQFNVLSGNVSSSTNNSGNANNFSGNFLTGVGSGGGDAGGQGGNEPIFVTDEEKMPNSFILPNGEKISLDSDGLGEKFQPGLNGLDIDALPENVSGVSENINVESCLQEEGDGGDSSKSSKKQNTDECSVANNDKKLLINGDDLPNMV
jgi:hypothetical protein